MSLCKTEGIVIQVVPFRDYDQIETIFTKDYGLLKLISKGVLRQKRSSKHIAAPLTCVDLVFNEGKGEISICNEMTILSSYSALRQSYNLLETGCHMLKDIHKTQLEGKPAPALYQLLKTYLDKLSLISDPLTLTSSFRLKILKHEGVLDLNLDIAKEELSLMDLLANSQSYSQIASLKIPHSLHIFIKWHFKECIDFYAK